MPTEFVKDPSAKLDYTFNWASWLPTGDTLSTYTVTCADTSITISSVTESAGIVTYWLEGGTIGKTYPVVCHVVTAAGRVADWTSFVQILDK